MRNQFAILRICSFSRFSWYCKNISKYPGFAVLSTIEILFIYNMDEPSSSKEGRKSKKDGKNHNAGHFDGATKSKMKPKQPPACSAGAGVIQDDSPASTGAGPSGLGSTSSSKAQASILVAATKSKPKSTQGRIESDKEWQWDCCPGRYVSLRPVHHPRKSLSERHPKRG